MNDSSRVPQVDKMIDDIVARHRALGPPAPGSVTLETADEALVAELAALSALDWPADEIGDRIARSVAARLSQPERDRAAAPSHAGRPQVAHSGRWLASGLGAVAAAAAVVIAISVVSPASRGHGTRPSGVAQGAGQSAHGFLLASAVRAASVPAKAGTVWYVRRRDFLPSESVVANRKLDFGATVALTTETWDGATRSRMIVNEKVAFSFASAADKAKWESAGKPPLSTMGTPFGSTRPVTSNHYLSARPETSGYYAGLGPSIGRRVTWAQFRALPSTAAVLGKTLRGIWNGIPKNNKAASDTFGAYLIQWADALFTGPATPGTRAAMYRLLARQPGIRIIRSVTDPLGRTGVAIADGPARWGSLIVEPHTVRLLAFTIDPVHTNSTIERVGTEVYEAYGWAGQIGSGPSPQA